MDSQGAGGKPLVETQEDLREHFGKLSPLAEKKVLNHLDKFCRDFIALSPFLVVATSDGRVLKSWEGLPKENTTSFINEIKQLADAGK